MIHNQRLYCIVVVVIHVVVAEVRSLMPQQTAAAAAAAEDSNAAVLSSIAYTKGLARTIIYASASYIHMKHKVYFCKRTRFSDYGTKRRRRRRLNHVCVQLDGIIARFAVVVVVIESNDGRTNAMAAI